MLEIIGLAAAAAAGGLGYLNTKPFVRRRLRYIEAVRRPEVAVGVGVAAAVVAAPVVWVLPIVGAGAALAFGAGVGAGVWHGGRRDRLGGGG